MGICISYTSLKKSNIGWPQQPQTEKVINFKMVFCDSSPNSIFSKHQNKAEIQNLDDSEVLINDFPGIRTSAASVTSSASAASMASTTSEQWIFRWLNRIGTNPNGNVQLSVAYLGPLPTLNSH